MATNWIGLDIGGANLKLASKCVCHSAPFELWKQPENLATALNELLANVVPSESSSVRLAVTMTGELADCYESKADGVAHICDAVLEVANDNQPVFYQTNGQFVDCTQAKSEWQQTAAANWHALASFVGLQIPDCLVVDIGSTTTDIVPVQNGIPSTIGKTDLTRLQNHELLYTGVSRTPISAVCNSVQLNSRQTPLAAELFASMLDVYLLLERIDESNSTDLTADGRAADIPAARRRIAKMICADEDELESSMIDDMARQIADSQQSTIANAIRTVLARAGNLDKVILAGEGDWLAKTIFDNHKEFKINTRSITDLADDPISSQLISHTGPAYAVAHLAQSQLGIE